MLNPPLSFAFSITVYILLLLLLSIAFNIIERNIMMIAVSLLLKERKKKDIKDIINFHSTSFFMNIKQIR